MMAEEPRPGGPLFDLWTSRYPDSVLWGTIDDFLSGREREGPRVEYRTRIDGSRDERVPRIAETIGAMANSGGGLIFVGVKQNEDDRPGEWPTLQRDELTTQRIENLCRSALDPYVPVDIGRGDHPDGKGSVWVIRVPSEFVGKPVFVEGKGILWRVGEASVPAPASQIRAWLVEDERHRDQVAGRLTKAIPAAPSLPDLAFLMAVTPTSSLASRGWGDDVDDKVERLVKIRFGDMAAMAISEDIVDFTVENERGDLLRRVWVDAEATVFRRYLFVGQSDEPVDALRIGGEIQRTWRFAVDAVEAISPGYHGDLMYRIAVGSVKGGFRSHPSMTHQLGHVNPRPAWHRSDWVHDGSRSRDAGWEDLVRTSLGRMLRAFGYRRVEAVLDEIVLLSPRSASAMDPPW